MELTDNAQPLPRVMRASGSTAKFFALTFAVTWLGSAVALQGGLEGAGLPGVILRLALLLAATFAPALVAIVLTAQDEGTEGLRGLLTRLRHVRVPGRWYLFALGYGVALWSAFAVAVRFNTGAWPYLTKETWVNLAMAMALALPVQAGEEIGWRGYALPRLAGRFGFARASLILGLIWASWHLPLFYTPAITLYGQSFPMFLLEVVAISVAMTWLYVHTKGSLLLATLMHWSINQSGRIASQHLPTPGNPFALSTSAADWAAVALLWIAAVSFLVRLRRLSH